MMRRFLSMPVVAAMLSTIVVASATPAFADCAQDPTALTFNEMIDLGMTGKDGFPAMFLGVVASIKDVGGDPDGGPTIARLDVVEHPVGYAPPVSRVRFRQDFPNMQTIPNLEFKSTGRYVVIARQLDDGSFSSDGACGQTKRLNRTRFREFVRYARSH